MSTYMSGLCRGDRDKNAPVQHRPDIDKHAGIAFEKYAGKIILQKNFNCRKIFSFHSETPDGNYRFLNRKGGIFCSGKGMNHPEAETEGQSRVCAEAYNMYAAQEKP
jgi:hypothetical protein